MAKTKNPTTAFAGNLEQGDRFLNPSTGEVVVFIRFNSDEDGLFAEVQSSRSFSINLDPTTLVNLEA